MPSQIRLLPTYERRLRQNSSVRSSRGRVTPFPTSDLTIYQIQNTFAPSTYEASGFAHILGLQAVKPFKTGNAFFPTWVTRTTLPVVTTADPDGEIPIGPGNGTEFSLPIDNQAGLGDLVFISIFNHLTQWGSWGVGPGFVAPTATRLELGEQSWKFSPTFAVVHTAIPTWQLGTLSVYNFPLDNDGTQTLQFQPLIVKQLGGGWFTGWGDDLWSFNTETGNFDMPLQLRLERSIKSASIITTFLLPELTHPMSCEQVRHRSGALS